jgi:hypothetical protein
VATALTPGARLVPTHDLLSSPGFVYLSGDAAADIRRDYDQIRTWESRGCYVD